MIGIVVSRADEASVQIGDQLRDQRDWDSKASHENAGLPTFHADGFALAEFTELHLSLENAASRFDAPDLLVFVSRHAGDTGPLLTAHFTGNFGPAEYGGSDHELATAAPSAQKRVIESLNSFAPPGYSVGIECTHHGPSGLDIPAMFVEVGSTEEQWNDPTAADAVARAVMALQGISPKSDRAIVGFGGGHYAPRFQRILTETDWAVGHIGADWALEAMGQPDPSLIEQAFERSGATRALIDGERPELAAVITQLGYEIVSETWLRETSGVSFELVERLESDLCSVDQGLRFGTVTETDSSYHLYTPDPSLLRVANGIDAAATRQLFRAHTIAFETREGGHLIDGRIALSSDSQIPPLLDGLVDILKERFEQVQFEGDEIIAREREFDPTAARELGVPEGPDFGRLAEGHAVRIDGHQITPEQVYVDRTERFQI